jgi:hypothetical protein
VKIRDFAYDPSCACETDNTGECSSKCLLHEIMAFEMSLTNQTVSGQAPSKSSMSSKSESGVMVFSNAQSHPSLSSESGGVVPVPPSPELQQQQQQARMFPQFVRAAVEDADEDEGKKFGYDEGWAEGFASRAPGAEVVEAPAEDEGGEEYPEMFALSSVDGGSEPVTLQSTQDDTGSSDEKETSSSEENSSSDGDDGSSDEEVSSNEEASFDKEENSSDQEYSSDEEDSPEAVPLAPSCAEPELEPLLGCERSFCVGFTQQATDSAPEPISEREPPFGVGFNQCDLYRGKLFFDDDEQEDRSERHTLPTSTPSLTSDNGTESSDSSENSYDSNGDRVVYLTMPARGTIAQRRLLASGYDVEMMERQQSYFFTCGRLRTSENMDLSNIFREINWNGRASVGVSVSWGPSVESTMRAQSAHAAAVEGRDERVHAPTNWSPRQHRDAGDELLGFPCLPPVLQLRRTAAYLSGEVLAFDGDDVSFGGIVEHV